jgi:hypothetical protein
MFENDDDVKTPSQTEDSAERGIAKKERNTSEPVTYRDMGRSEELDQENVGDIADEGRGHRG